MWWAGDKHKPKIIHFKTITDNTHIPYVKIGPYLLYKKYIHHFPQRTTVTYHHTPLKTTGIDKRYIQYQLKLNITKKKCLHIYTYKKL